jgi:molybdopterin-guanine dinucleotide biosynthesis protein A
MISAALLAGGQSRRMGRDKCLIEIHGVPLWQRQLALLSALSTDVTIVAPSRPDWCPHAARWIPDRTPGCGPLGGLDAALASASHERLLLLAVDLPEMTSDYLQSLVTISSNTCGVVAAIDGLFQPLCAIYPRAVLPVVISHLAGPDKSLQHLLRELVATGQMKSIPVAPSELFLFRNLNTPQD